MSHVFGCSDCGQLIWSYPLHKGGGHCVPKPTSQDIAHFLSDAENPVSKPASAPRPWQEAPRSLLQMVELIQWANDQARDVTGVKYLLRQANVEPD